MIINGFGETMQGCKTPAMRVHLEHRAIARTAALLRRPIQGVARQNQSGNRKNSIAVGILTGRNMPSRRKTMQGRKGLRRHPTSRYQAETRYQRGQEEQILNASFQERLGLLVVT